MRGFSEDLSGWGALMTSRSDLHGVGRRSKKTEASAPITARRPDVRHRHGVKGGFYWDGSEPHDSTEPEDDDDFRGVTNDDRGVARLR